MPHTVILRLTKCALLKGSSMHQFKGIYRRVHNSCSTFAKLPSQLCLPKNKSEWMFVDVQELVLMAIFHKNHYCVYTAEWEGNTWMDIYIYIWWQCKKHKCFGGTGTTSEIAVKVYIPKTGLLQNVVTYHWFTRCFLPGCVCWRWL